MTDLEKEYVRIAKNINRQLLRIEKAGYTYASAAYQEILHPKGQFINKLKSSSARISTSKTKATQANIGTLQKLSNRLSMKTIKASVAKHAQQNKMTFNEALANIRQNSLFANLTEQLSAYYDSARVSEMLQEYDKEPTYDEFIIDLVRDRGQELWDRDPLATKELFEQALSCGISYAKEIDSDYLTQAEDFMDSPDDTGWIAVAYELGIDL